MSPEARGIYINLLGRAWNSEDGGLPTENEELCTLASCVQRSFNKCSTVVRNCFFEHRNRLFNRKLCALRVAQIARRAQTSDAGKKSAEARKDSKNEENTQHPLNERTTSVQRGGQRRVNPPTPTPSSSPTPSSKEKKKRENTSHLFKNSPFFDFDKFREKLPQWSEETCRHYWEAAGDHSASKAAKYHDWIATVRNWHRRDQKNGTGGKESPKSFRDQDYEKRQEEKRLAEESRRKREQSKSS